MNKGTGSINQRSAGTSRKAERIIRELKELRFYFAEDKGRIAEAIELIESLVVEEDLTRMEGQGEHYK